MSNQHFLTLCLLPLAVFSLAFLALPLVQLLLGAAGSEAGWGIYLQILSTPRYLTTLGQTVMISLLVTGAALLISTTAGLYLSRARFFGRGALISILTLPLAFPGVVIGFLIILLGGRQGLVIIQPLSMQDRRAERFECSEELVGMANSRKGQNPRALPIHAGVQRFQMPGQMRTGKARAPCRAVRPRYKRRACML